MCTVRVLRSLLIGLVAGFLALPAGAAPGTRLHWPTRGWPTASPESVGLDAGALEAFDKEISAGRYGYVDGILVIRHGRIAFERHYAHDYDQLFVGKGAPWIYNYYDPEWHPFYKRTSLHTMQSVSKSVTSALIGIAIHRGEIAGVDASVLPYFAAFRIEPDARRERMRLWNVLTMTTGIAWDESSATYTDLKNNCAQMEASDGTPQAYAAIGYGGQYLIVIPRLDLIAVVTGWNISDERSLPVKLALERVMAAASD